MIRFLNIILVSTLALFLSTGCKNNPSSPGSEQDSVSYAGKIYHTVKIGNQTWLKENLDIGTMIQVDQDPLNNGTIEKYCYNNDPVNCTMYGGLYQWNEAMAYNTTPGTKGICPDGFHIPTKGDYEILTTSVSNNSNSLKALGQGAVAGTGTNTSGFSALLAGNRYNDGYFYDLHEAGNFWTSTEYGTGNAYRMFLYVSYTNIAINHIIKNIGFSVRCIKD